MGNLFQFATAVSSILSFVPALIQCIQAVEAAIPGKGQGQTKLDVVLSTVQHASAATQATLDQVNVMRPAVEQLTNQLVAAFNATNAWPKIAAPVPVQSAAAAVAPVVSSSEPAAASNADVTG